MFSYKFDSSIELRTFHLCAVAIEPETGPPGGLARRGLEGVETDRGNGIADLEDTITTVDDTCVDVSVLRKRHMT